jgi:protein gp37
MAKITAISWAASTNPFWKGCNEMGVECLNCYAKRFMERQQPGSFHTLVRAPDEVFYQVLKWSPRTIFHCSMSDFFHHRADDWREDAWDVIRRTPFHDHLILTKRIDRVVDHLPKDWGDGWDHVWIGTSAGNQEAADERVPILVNEVPSKHKFISAEPLIGPVDVWFYLNRVDQIITGGESGYDSSKLRPMDARWVLDIHDQAEAAGAIHFHKQNGGTQKFEGEYGGYHVGADRLVFRDLPDFPSMRKPTPAEPDSEQLTLF